MNSELQSCWTVRGGCLYFLNRPFIWRLLLTALSSLVIACPGLTKSSLKQKTLYCCHELWSSCIPRCKIRGLHTGISKTNDQKAKHSPCYFSFSLFGDLPAVSIGTEHLHRQLYLGTPKCSYSSQQMINMSSKYFSTFSLVPDERHLLPCPFPVWCYRDARLGNLTSAVPYCHFN